jgi:hypothetical protein
VCNHLSRHPAAWAKVSFKSLQPQSATQKGKQDFITEFWIDLQSEGSSSSSAKSCLGVRYTQAPQKYSKLKQTLVLSIQQYNETDMKRSSLVLQICPVVVKKKLTLAQQNSNNPKD